MFGLKYLPLESRKAAQLVADWMSRPAILKVLSVTSEPIRSDPSISVISDQVSQIRAFQSDPTSSVRYDLSWSDSTDSIYI